MVQAIYENVEEVIFRFIRDLEEQIRVEKVILFGSYARGTPRPFSDIDLIVISPDFHGGTLEDHILLAKVARRITPQIEALPYLPQDFQEADSRSFEGALLHEGKTVYPKVA